MIPDLRMGFCFSDDQCDLREIFLFPADFADLRRLKNADFSRADFSPP
jgi:uncharacterized protein YjbI with pentapeptide repeats